MCLRERVERSGDWQMRQRLYPVIYFVIGYYLIILCTSAVSPLTSKKKSVNDGSVFLGIKIPCAHYTFVDAELRSGSVL